MAVQLNDRTGITCGKRSNGERCVLWSDDMFEWFKVEEFNDLFV